MGGLVALGLVVGACGGDDGGSDAEAPVGSDSTGTTAPGTTGGGAVTTTGTLADGVVELPQGQALAIGEPRRGGEVTVGIETLFVPLDPAVAARQTQMNQSIYGELVGLTPDGLGYEPVMLESLEPNDDLTVWTAKLRPDMVFHDGTPYDAAALAANWTWLKDPANKWPYLSVMEPVASWEATDDVTFVVTTKRPFTALFQLMLPANATGLTPSPTARAAKGADYGRSPVGAGPFKFESWNESRVVLTRNDTYFDPELPYLDKLTFVTSTDSQAELAAVQTGDIDIALSQSDADFERAESEGIRVLRQRSFTPTATIFNTEKEPVNDIRVRRALKLAIDEQVLVDTVFDGQRAVAIGPTQPNHPWHVPVEGWPGYDPDEARRLIEEYETETGNEVRFEFEMWDPPEMQQMFTVVNQMWAAVGAEITMRPLGVAQLIADATSGAFVAQSVYWGYFGVVPDVSAAYVWSSTGGYNATRLKDPVMDAALATAAGTNDRAIRLREFGKAQQIMADNLGTLFHNIQSQVFLVGDAVKGFPAADPSGTGTTFRPATVWV